MDVQNEVDYLKNQNLDNFCQFVILLLLSCLINFKIDWNYIFVSIYVILSNIEILQSNKMRLTSNMEQSSVKVILIQIAKI